MDVCPDPSNTICRGCGISNPAEDHRCVPKCGLCGGKHLTADKACKARFKTPYIVRRRRWERRRAEEEDAGRRNRDKRGPAGGPHRNASKQRGRSHTPDRSSNNSGGRNSRRSRSRSKTPSGGSNGGGNRRSRSRTSSRSRASSRSRSASTGRRGIAEKKVGWTNRSPVARTSDTEFPPLSPSQPLNSQANPQKDSSEVLELKRIIERQNAQIQEQNAQIRALMNRIEALANNGSSENASPENNITAANNAPGLRRLPRRDPPAGVTQRTSSNQEAMDAEMSPASGEEATTAETTTTATAQIPREGELTAILAAISQINERLSKMDARLEAVESQPHMRSVKHKRLAPKVASTAVTNRFASLKKERSEKIKGAIAKRRNRLDTSGKDDAESK
ncbi:serine/arginine repetitive matrix protein 2-like [Dermacentor albipictus]|uniref:serine/arginine repetitive matrix protein 2-like n=1 Tax=Dermacentor albipictus TaxID=60249 RepID=UPI0038FC7432